MHIRRFSEAPQFQAPKHWDMRSLRLQHLGTPGGPEHFGVSLSYFLPGGGAGPDASPSEKSYVLLEGDLEIRAGDETGRLNRYDSCLVPAGQERYLVNPGPTVATVLVITGRAPA